MTRRKRIICVPIILYIAVLFLFPQLVLAEDQATPANNQGIGFSYKVIQPENQRNKEVGYLDLRMTAGQKQIVQIELSNGRSEEIIVGVSLNGAKTNSIGVIEYGPSAIENDKSLKYDFVDVVKGPEKVAVPANSMVPLELEITMPDSTFDGVISGGIQLKLLPKDEKKEEEKSGITNEYAYLIGMILNETDVPVTPDMTLNKIHAGLTNYRNAVFINMSNTQAEYIEEMTTDVQIMPKDSEKVLYDTKKADMRMAPNSVIDFPVEMNGEKMVPGDYKAHVLVTAANNQKWEWTENFTITNEEADKFNSQDVSLVQERGIDWKLIALIAVGGFAVIIAIFFAIRFYRNKKEQERRKKKKPKTSKKK